MDVISSEASVLSAREKQVLHWVCKGKSNWEIGQILGLSEFTVKNHVSRILKKLQASNRHHAAAKGVEMGLMEFVF